MSNPFDSNPFEEPAKPINGRGANPFAEPARESYAAPSANPSAERFADPAAEPSAEPFAEPERAYPPAPMQDYSLEQHSPGGTIHSFSLFKGLLSLFSVLVGFTGITDGDVAMGIGFALPGTWYFLKSLQQKANPTTPQKRHWFVIWMIAIVLMFFGA
ncbi:hypothetical protein HMPREF2996_06180 [Corynebacterium sp. HMSC066C02]|uniref:hypothetical protein n=1 Tax=Corynebacterium sp. HMSC066C02 TaxID=1739500 RepID=UPI0008A3D009|nr:hypothetical protein [Corynebacterium sp. HMSC066C02]OFP20860.1 hypothetical protein HMPREF2996_06180 [Corynebacterium sp. HMSC066C02]